MRTKVINLYSFDELSEEAQQKAIEQYKEGNRAEDLVHWDYAEAYETVKAFNDLFRIKEGNRSWLDFSTNFDNEVYELKGLRLRTWIVNNYWDSIYRPTYVGSFGDNKIVSHKRVRTVRLTSKGRRVDSYNSYYSGINREASCPFTGVCWDNSMIKPLIDFIDYKDPKNMDYYDIDGLISDCFDSLRRSLKRQTDYYYSDEFISEELENMGETFNEEGNLI